MKNPLNAVQLAYQCPKLEHLDVDCTIMEGHLYKLFNSKHTLKTLIISDKISISNQHVANLLKLPNLEHFEVHHYVLESQQPMSHTLPLMNMKCLSLNILPKPGESMFSPFWIRRTTESDEIVHCEQMPKLEKFTLLAVNVKARVSTSLFFCLEYICYPNFKNVSFSNVKLVGAFGFHENLENLSLIHCLTHSTTWIDDGLPLMLPNLKSLILHLLNWIDFTHVDRILRHNSGVLENLQIVLCDNFTVAGLEQIISSVPDHTFQNLKSLHVYGMGLYDLGDATLFRLLEKAPLLRELHVPHTKVTGSLIKRFIQLRDQPSGEENTTKNSSSSSSGISVLNLSGCVDVSYEALDWGRLNGLKILRQ